jgi:hypothetical protein
LAQGVTRREGVAIGIRSRLQNHPSALISFHYTRLHLSKPRRVNALLVPERKMAALKKAFTTSMPRSDIPELHKLFKGE